MITSISSALLALAPSFTAQDLPEAVLAQVPTEAVFCYRIESLDSLDTTLSTMSALFPERFGDAITVDTLLAQMPELDAAAIDRTRPLFAYMTSLDFAGPAPIYAYIPSLDPAALAAGIPAGLPILSLLVDEHYVAITNDPIGFPKVTTPSALPRALSDAPFSAALDLSGSMRQQVGLAKFVITMIKAKSIGEFAQDQSAPAVLRDYVIDWGTELFDHVIDFVDSVGQVTFSLDFSGTALDLDIGLLLRPDAVYGRLALPARTPMRHLEPAIDTNAVMSYVVNLDLGGWIDANMPMLEKGLADIMTEFPVAADEVPLGWGGPEEFLDSVHETMVNGLMVLSCFRKNVVLQLDEMDNYRSMKVLTTGSDLDTLTVAAQNLAKSDLLKVMGFALQVEPENDAQTKFSFRFDPEVFAQSFDMQSTSNQETLNALSTALDQPFEWTLTANQGVVGVELQPSRPQRPVRSGALELALEHIGEMPVLFFAHVNYGKYFAENPRGLILDESAAELTQAQLDAIARVDMPSTFFVTFDGSAAHVGLTADLKQLPALIQIIEHPPQPPTPEELADFNTNVLPIFEAKCADCHGERRQKEGLRLDSLDALRIGSKHGAVIQPGDAANSLLYQLISTPLDDDDHMPPSKKPQPSAEDIAAIKAWINRQS